MPAYNIIGGLDFYAKLNEVIEDDCISDDQQTCLITNMPLDDTRVELSCGHKFNYEPLFNDIVNHKKKFNSMEYNGRLRSDQIRCPYCRGKQSQLLPYIENEKYPKIHGVNYYDEKQAANDKSSNRTYCDWGSCTNCYSIIYSSLLNKSLCTFHTKMGMKDLLIKKKLELKMAKLQAKEDAKAAKLQAKEDAKAAKLQAKEDAKAAKLQAKEDAKIAKLQGKNVKINNPIVTTDVNSVISSGCQWVMVSGKNKGKLCGSKIKENNCCSRHMNK
jgi:hypothetical protein